ncbi:MAG: sulfatase [Thermoanaerobaculia bacterium]
MINRSSQSICILLVLLVTSVAFVGPLYGEQKRPNVVLIVVDDLRFDEIGVGGHPYLETPNIDRLATEGAVFTSAYHSTPLCSPNRASILTGQYVSRHGILDNTSRSHASHRLDLFPKELQEAGYSTAHVGKWHMGNDPTPRPGYDYWVSFAGQGKTNDPDLYEDGGLHPVEGYITDIFTDRAIDFITKSDGRPFFLYIGHKAVHPEAKQLDDGTVDLSVPREFIPAERHKGRYDGKVVERRPNYGFSEEERLTKPVIKEALDIRHELEKDEDWAREIDPGISETTIQRRAEMMLAVDEGVGRILDTLGEIGELDNTLIIFTSENGYFYGEHGLAVERRLPYEESVRTPLLMRYPQLVEPGTIVDSLVTSIDLAPTVLDVTGTEIPEHVQGKSLTPLLGGLAEKVQDSILIEFYSHENPFPWTAKLDYRIVRKGKYKYIRWIRFEDEAELYDLETDPYELNNLVKNPAMAAIVEDLEKDMRRLVLESLGLDG